MARNLDEIEKIASRTLSLLRERIPVTQAYLFGSQAEGIPDENSDIDIAAFSPAADAMDAATRVALVIDVERQVGALVGCTYTMPANTLKPDPPISLGICSCTASRFIKVSIPIDLRQPA